MSNNQYDETELSALFMLGQQGHSVQSFQSDMYLASILLVMDYGFHDNCIPCKGLHLHHP